MVRSCNIYWRDAKSKSLSIEKAGKAFVAKEGSDRLRVFWLGQESAEAVAWLDKATKESSDESVD